MPTMNKTLIGQVADYYSITNTKLEACLIQNHSGIQHFKVNPAKHEVRYGKSGMQLNIPAFAIRTSAGQKVNGLVDLYLIENVDPVDMITSYRSTSSNGHLIECTCQFLLTASLDNKTLQLASAIEVSYPSPRESRHPLTHSFFSGSKSSIRSIDGTYHFSWQGHPASSIRLVKKQGHSFLNFKINQFNWYALARMVPVKDSRHMLNIKLASSLDRYTEIKAFLVFPEVRGIFYLHQGMYGFTALGVPNHLQAIAIVLARTGQQFFIGGKKRGRSKEKWLHVDLYPVNPGNLEGQIRNLLFSS